MTRQEALNELKSDHYPEALREEDKEYFMKKLGFSSKEFEEIMNQRAIPHTEFKSYTTGLYNRHEVFMRFVNKTLNRK